MIMAKAVAYFYGSDTYGRHHQVAFREDGVPFHSEYRYNGYGKSWSKWRRMKPDEYQRGDTLQEACERGTFSWGWRELSGGRQDGLKLRLPDQ